MGGQIAAAGNPVVAVVIAVALLVDGQARRGGDDPAAIFDADPSLGKTSELRPERLRRAGAARAVVRGVPHLAYGVVVVEIKRSPHEAVTMRIERALLLSTCYLPDFPAFFAARLLDRLRSVLRSLGWRSGLRVAAMTCDLPAGHC